MNTATHKSLNKRAECNGAILVGPFGHYCHECRAFGDWYEFPSGSDTYENQAAYNDGEIQSPEASPDADDA